MMNRKFLAVLLTLSIALPVSAQKTSVAPPSKTAEKKVEKNLYNIANKIITIHIDRMADDSFRYSAWNKPKKTSEKPDLIIKNGEVEKQGSQNGYNFKFQNGKWTYIVEDNQLGDNVSGGIILTVLNDGEEKIYSQMVNLKVNLKTLEISSSKIYAGNKNMVVKIDQMSNGDMQYRAWNKPKKITDTPDVIADYGQIQYAPKLDGYIYSFLGKKASYIIREKDETNDITLRIIKDGEKEEQISLKDLFSVPEVKKVKNKKVDKKVVNNLYHIANKAFTIKVDWMNDGSFRYSVWNKPKKTSEKPDLLIENGTEEKQGTQGGYHYQFKNGKWTYTIQDNQLGDNVSVGIILNVFEGDEERIYNQMVNLKANPKTIKIDMAKIHAGNENMVIKIDQMTNGDLRYRAWNKPKKITNKPDVTADYGQILYGPKSDGYIYAFHGKTISHVIREKDGTNNILLRIIRDNEKEERINLKDLFSVSGMKDENKSKTGLASFDPSSESFGGWLMAGTKESQILKKLGKPEKTSKGSQMEATETFVQDWDYPSKGIFISMESPKAGDKKKVSGVTLKSPAKLALKKGIGIGSSREDVFSAYGKHIDTSTRADNEMIAGDIYEGIFFTLTNEKVTEIYIGTGAE